MTRLEASFLKIIVEHTRIKPTKQKKLTINLNSWFRLIKFSIKEMHDFLHWKFQNLNARLCRFCFDIIRVIGLKSKVSLFE